MATKYRAQLNATTMLGQAKTVVQVYMYIVYIFSSCTFHVSGDPLYDSLLSVFLSVCLSICLSFYQSIFLFVCLSICLSFYLSVFLSVCLSICLSLYLSFFLPVFLSICLSLYLSFFLSVFLSICLSFYLSVFLFCCLSYIFLSFPANLFFLLRVTTDIQLTIKDIIPFSYCAVNTYMNKKKFYKKN